MDSALPPPPPSLLPPLPTLGFVGQVRAVLCGARSASPGATARPPPLPPYAPVAVAAEAANSGGFANPSAATAAADAIVSAVALFRGAARATAVLGTTAAVAAVIAFLYPSRRTGNPSRKGKRMAAAARRALRKLVVPVAAA